MIENQEQLRCSYCDELVSSKAKKCKHCGEILDPQLREIEALKRENANRDKTNNIVVSNNNNNNQSSSGRKRFPHIAHLIFSIITLPILYGTWVLVWLLHYIFRNKDNYS